jgi:hypothetical protein
MKFLAIRLDAKVAKALKAFALAHDMTIQQVITELVCRVTNLPVPEVKTKRKAKDKASKA